MGLLDRFFNTKAQNIFYYDTPTLYLNNSSLYDLDLTRAIINSFATHISKLNAVVKGSSSKNSKLDYLLNVKANDYMTGSQFLYKLATYYAAENNAYIVPLLDKYENLIGLYPIGTSNSEIVESDGIKYLRFKMEYDKTYAVELSKVGHLKNHYYNYELKGSDNSPLEDVLQSLKYQQTRLKNGVKNGNGVRMIAKTTTPKKERALKELREQFVKDNFEDNPGGMIIVDNTYESVTPVDNKPFLINDSQINYIKNTLYIYFGTNEHILMNQYTEDEWNAYYESKIEPFAIQISQVMSAMFYSEKEISFNNEIVFESNKMQYLSNQSKLNTVTQLFDRGFITHDDGCDIFNLAHTGASDGNKYYIRREYVDVEKLDKVELTGDDMLKGGGGSEKKS